MGRFGCICNVNSVITDANAVDISGRLCSSVAREVNRELGASTSHSVNSFRLPLDDAPERGGGLNMDSAVLYLFFLFIFYCFLPLTFRPSQHEAEALVILLLQDHGLLVDDAVTVEKFARAATVSAGGRHPHQGNRVVRLHHAGAPHHHFS